jgi:hypothetical protein
VTGAFICGCILFPLVLLALSTGGGLLVRRLAGEQSFSTVLVVPVGFALLVATCSFVTWIGWLAPAAGYVALAFALAGFVLQARAGGLRVARPQGALWPALAALVPFAAVGAPTLLTGTPTWTGYTRITDIGFQMDFSQYLAEAGRATTTFDSSYHANAQKLVSIGYPGGGQATLGSIAALIHTNVAWCYQLYHAFAAAAGALAVYALLAHVCRSRPLRAVAAAVAIQPNVLYGYALEGGIKELTTASLLMVSAAVLAERLPGRDPARSLLPAAVALSGAIAGFSIGVAPWLGIVLAGLLLASLLPRGRARTLLRWAQLAVATVLLSLPGVISAATQLSGIAGHAIGGTVELGLGNLSAPVPDWSAAGVWLTGDFRFPLVHVTATHVLDGFVIALAVVGIVFALVRRRWVLVLLGVSGPIAIAYYIAHTSPWLQFKAFTITGVFALTLAFAGAAALHRARLPGARLAGWLAAAVVAGGVLYGNALIYHDITLAPAARYYELASLSKRYEGQGPTLFPAFDEYAEYFLRFERGSSYVQPAYDEWGLLPGVLNPGEIGFAFNLNQFQLAFLQKFKLIVEPRNPAGVRAPSNWDLVQQTRYFNVWRRVRPARDVYAHLPLSGGAHERSAAYCRHFAAEVARAGSGASVAYAAAPPSVQVAPAAGVHPDYWLAAGSGVSAYGAGSDRISFTLPARATYSVWIAGTIGRPIKFALDGRHLGTISYEERYPGQFLHIATRTLSAGRHTLLIERGGGSLHPGSGDDVDPDTRGLGPILFSTAEPALASVHVAPAAAAARVCAAPIGYQWLEALKPGGAPPGALPARA